MALYAYMQRTQQLIADLKEQVVNPAFLIAFINSARGQIAGEGECIRVIGTIPTVIGTRSYSFASIALATTGVQGVLNVRRLTINLGSGQSFLSPLPWEYFDLYLNNNTAPVTGPPTVWAQYAQGSLGSFHLDPTPDTARTINADCVCYPAALASDADVETIPYSWTDCIPYFAAYLAYLSVQRPDAARAMLDLYRAFMQRARRSATPAVMPFQYEQSSPSYPAAAAGIPSPGERAS